MAALNKDDSDTTTLESAEDALVEAFENYEDALYNVTGEVTLSTFSKMTTSTTMTTTLTMMTTTRTRITRLAHLV